MIEGFALIALVIFVAALFSTIGMVAGQLLAEPLFNRVCVWIKREDLIEGELEITDPDDGRMIYRVRMPAFALDRLTRNFLGNEAAKNEVTGGAVVVRPAGE